MSLFDIECSWSAYLLRTGLIDSWVEQEEWRKAFVRKFPISSIRALSKDEYVQGKKNTDSFCYWLEWHLKALGHIQGSTVKKFGFWYSQKNKCYEFTKKFGATEEIAFERVKQAIVELIEAGKRRDLDAIAKNLISPMFKGKILYLYYPEEYLNIFSDRHLHYFLDAVGLQPNKKSEIFLQDRLMQLKASHLGLGALTTNQFSSYLYYRFGTPPKNGPSVFATNQVTATFVGELPEGSREYNTQVPSGGVENPDYTKRAEKLKAIGNLGEEIVLELERKRLCESGVVCQPVHVALTNDAAGYDILSYEDDGETPRYIEVKATTAKDLSRGFYLSDNEFGKSFELDNYYLYIVFDVKSNSPRVWRRKAPFSSDQFELQPIQYRVFGASKEV